jgi:polyhydroxyalkanoate synthesis regulator phasin
VKTRKTLNLLTDHIVKTGKIFLQEAVEKVDLIVEEKMKGPLMETRLPRTIRGRIVEETWDLEVVEEQGEGVVAVEEEEEVLTEDVEENESLREEVAVTDRK